MTEYITSPDPTLIFKNSKERTTHWVRSHSPYHSRFHSPDSPPSAVGELDERDSDEDSSHSLPPKMVLRYGDSRGDIPISHWHYENAQDVRRHGSQPRSRPQAYHGHDRARSTAGHHRDYVHHSMRHALPRAYQDDFSTPPEDIHILPSDPNVQPHRPAGTYRPRRASEPHRRPLDDEPETISPLPPAPAPQRHPHPPHSHSHLEAPPVVYSHSQHIHYDHDHDHPHPHHSHSRSRPPPSIVYPAHPHAKEHYAPPTIVYSHKAPGMSYTVSAPTGNGFPQYPRIVATPLQPVRSNLSSVYEEPRLYKDESEEGTYYVPGQKVKVLVEPSVYTASSTTKSGSALSPYSIKRPLITRLMRFASELRPTRRMLHRRHSLENASRARSRDR